MIFFDRTQLKIKPLKERIHDIDIGIIMPLENVKSYHESMKNVGDVNDLEKHEKEVYSDREQAILINISNSPVAKTQHVLPLVLGAAHDIAPELLEWNRHSRQKFGLITFTPEKTK